MEELLIGFAIAPVLGFLLFGAIAGFESQKEIKELRKLIEENK